MGINKGQFDEAQKIVIEEYRYWRDQTNINSVEAVVIGATGACSNILATLMGLIPRRCDTGDAAAVRRFRIVNSAGQKGWCYSMFDSFDIWWDDGSTSFDVVELSLEGIKKVQDDDTP